MGRAAVKPAKKNDELLEKVAESLERRNTMGASVFPEYPKEFLTACKLMAFDQVFPGIIKDHPVDFETAYKELVKKFAIDSVQTLAIVDSFVAAWEKKKRKMERPSLFRFFRKRKTENPPIDPESCGTSKRTGTERL